MRYHSRSFAICGICSLVGILIVGAESCGLDENGLQPTEAGPSVDSTSGSSSTSSSSSSSSGVPTVCGDMKVEAPETCDDGNTKPGDRCSGSCATENPTVCPGTPITLAKGSMITISDTTVDGEDNFVGSRPGIGNCGGADYPGKDLIYAVTVLADGVLKAELDADYDNFFVRARPTCPSKKEEEIACEYRVVTSPATIEFMVTANSTYYVAADSWDNQAGTFRLTLSLN